jgi:glyoxylase-like metal-dependent hydrolase (beta-lactamase superfamily II)
MIRAQRPRHVAEGVWLLRARPGINVFLIEGPDGVTAFDSGPRGTGRAVARMAQPLGGIDRVLLSHAHPDHRGGAPTIAAPVLCHADERNDVEGDGGAGYFDRHAADTPLDHLRLLALTRLVDGGPVAVAEVVEEGDEVAGFTVVHLPGHAPGLIALWRERDGLVLASDAFTTDPKGEPRLARPCYSDDPDRARESLLRLARLRPATAWPAHGPPLTGRVGGALERAAAEPRS